jgi:dolichyl-phosphate beta-glucosyltransferase
LKIRIYDTQCGAKIFSRKICDDIFYEQFISPWLFDVELFARLLNVYGMEKTIQMSYENPVSKWIDIDSKVKPLFFLKAPFELFKIVRHYKLK